MGNKLFSQVTELTGLPSELIGPELRSMLAKKGVAPEHVTMDCLREALADYLSQVSMQIEAQHHFDQLDTHSGLHH